MNETNKLSESDILFSLLSGLVFPQKNVHFDYRELAVIIPFEPFCIYTFVSYIEVLYIRRKVLQYPFFWYNICSAKWIRNDTTADIRTLPPNVEQHKNDGLIQYDIISKTAYKKNCSRVPEWHPPDSQNIGIWLSQSAIKLH